MRGAAIIPVVAGIALTSGIALTQGAEDSRRRSFATAPRRSAPEGWSARTRRSRTIAPAHQAASKEDNWIISQTTSPVDYSPVVIATTMSHDGAAESTMKLSIRCRGGRTELVVAGPGISGRGNDYAISYRVNDGQQVQIAAVPPASGAGVAFAGDVIRLAAVSSRQLEASAFTLHPALGTALDGMFSLGGWETVRAKLNVACKWSHPAAKPNR